MNTAEIVSKPTMKIRQGTLVSAVQSFVPTAVTAKDTIWTVKLKTPLDIASPAGYDTSIPN